MKLRERDIEIDFTSAIDALVFDQMKRNQPNYHGIGEMCRVDFCRCSLILRSFLLKSRIRAAQSTN